VVDGYQYFEETYLLYSTLKIDALFSSQITKIIVRIFSAVKTQNIICVFSFEMLFYREQDILLRVAI